MGVSGEGQRMGVSSLRPVPSGLLVKGTLTEHSLCRSLNTLCVPGLEEDCVCVIARVGFFNNVGVISPQVMTGQRGGAAVPGLGVPMGPSCQWLRSAQVEARHAS